MYKVSLWFFRCSCQAHPLGGVPSRVETEWVWTGRSICRGRFQDCWNFLLRRLFLQFPLLQLGFEGSVPWCETFLILKNKYQDAILLGLPVVAHLGKPGWWWVRLLAWFWVRKGWGSYIDFTALEKIHSLYIDMPHLPVGLSPGRKAVMSLERKTLYELVLHCCLSYHGIPPPRNQTLCHRLWHKCYVMAWNSYSCGGT